MREIQKNAVHRKALVILLELFAVGIIIYLATAPAWPEAEYWFEQKFAVKEIRPTAPVEARLPISDKKGLVVQQSAGTSTSPVPASQEMRKNKDSSKTGNRLIISRIGVDAPIIESKNESWGLSRGAWRIPSSSSPDKGGNTVISGHRFRYLPPNNTTFYLFHKLKKGDPVRIIWNDIRYDYSITEIKVVNKDEVSILADTDDTRLTLFTCTPIFSQEKRLVVTARPVE